MVMLDEINPLNSTEKVLYKYRDYSPRSLGILENKELFFAAPAKLNDPKDCQFDIAEACTTAIEKLFGEDHKSKDIKAYLLSVVETFPHQISKMGVFSLANSHINHLMWAHYADGHRGFCIGLNLANKDYKSLDNLIVGAMPVRYGDDNPFENYLSKLDGNDGSVEDNDIFLLLTQALTLKTKKWSYEEETRLLRHKEGVANFDPQIVKEIVFGLKMPDQNKVKIREILDGGDWSHIKFKEIKGYEGSELSVGDAN
jgi:hypothetical protein